VTKETTLKRIADCLVIAFIAGVVRLGAAGGGAGLPIVKAVKAGDAPTVRALLKQPNAANAAEPDGTTALHWAVDRDDVAVAQMLVRAGANVKAANRLCPRARRRS
jgi:hypothetical protein